MSLWNIEGYVRLRHGGDDRALELFAERHVAPGTRVLELGCGPGRAAAALAERCDARVTAVDVSPEMLAAAREIVPPSVELVQARAEELPLSDASFDSALSNFAVHLFDRPHAFSEARRVLREDAVYWVKTADPERIGDHWAARLFPSFVGIELARFPGEEELQDTLLGAGFASVVSERLEVVEELSRDDVIERVRRGAYSTITLLGQDEVEAGIAGAPKSLPERIRHVSTLLIATASA